MPCRKENYILLEQSVTVGSKEVDALVTKIGEALQLHNNNNNNHHNGGGGGGGTHQKPGSVSRLHGGGGKAAGGTGGCCMRLRGRGHRGSSRASPYSLPGSTGEQEWVKPWSRRRLGGEEDDPHRLLQELILSGNLIKEAVRRLHFSAEDCADNVPC